MRIKTRLAELERANGTVDVGDNQLLVQLLGRRDAMFWPHRHHGDSRLGVHQKQRAYLDGSIGLSAKADGKINWKSMFEARQRLISSGFLSALYSGGQVTSLFITPLGEAYARALVGSRLKTIHQGVFAYVLIPADSWISESELFGQNLLGNPEDWNDMTELVLPLLVSGLVKSSSDIHGRCGYRRTAEKLLEDPPCVDVECDEAMDSIYIKAFNAERQSLKQCEPLDTNEVFIPLSVLSLGVVSDSVSESNPPQRTREELLKLKQELGMPDHIFDDLFGEKNGS